MATESDQTGKITWKVDGDKVQVSFPAGHEVFPQGKTVTFSALTPTDLINVQGVKAFPNKDGITAESITREGLTPEAIEKVVETFEQAAKVIDDADKLRERFMALVNQMRPQYNGHILLEDGALGMLKSWSNIPFPDQETLRLKTFAFGGVELRSGQGQPVTYSMVLDPQGKFDYNPQGILYRRNK